MFFYFSEEKHIDEPAAASDSGSVITPGNYSVFTNQQEKDILR